MDRPSGAPASEAPGPQQGPEAVAAPDLELLLPASPESVSVARQVVTGVSDCVGLDEDRRAEVALAVTEACTNVVMHAYPDGDGRYDMRVWLQQRRLVVSVRDQGRGIAPRLPDQKQGLGLGLALMLATCDEVSFVRGGEVSTEVRMTFRLPDGGGPG